jgi:lysophospholipase L1-like esterase
MASATGTTPATGTAATAGTASTAGTGSPPGAGAPRGTASPAGITSLSGPIVALGDSYTSGDLLPVSLSTPLGCLRSSADYAHLVAKALRDSSGLVNASCTSAGVADMTSAEHTSTGQNPPQLDSLSRGDALVMLTLGGDDLGFLNVLDKCMALSWRNLLGSPCRSYYDSGGTDKLAALVTAEAPRMAAALTQVHAKAPGARVLLVGYPDLFPQHGGCWPVVPITNGDISYLRGIEVKLNAMLAGEAKATGTTFVDTYDPTIGHDFCTSAKIRDVEGLIPATLTAPFHPNARGQAAMAAQVLKALAA